MAPIYAEVDFETHIEQHLLNSGYRAIDPASYDRDLGLLPQEVLAFLRATQPEALDNLARQYGANTEASILNRLAKELNKRGALDVLRKGVKDRGETLHFAYFQPSSGMNPDHQALYTANRFAVVRQLRYSLRNENAIDMVLFLNGIPIITAELKNSLTGQMVENAVKQYKYDRNPKGEPLLAFQRCLVHFAVGNEAIYMTTHLAGAQTRFLPFNKDVINPVNPTGHKTHYLWEDIWQPATLLELIHNYLLLQTNTEKVYDPVSGQLVEKTSKVLIFPRYHQLDVVRSMLTAVRAEGVGHNYLVQHSAGSGKSNSIAWLAHHLASFYQLPSDRERLFDSIIVVTDRRVLDQQLQNTISQFEQVPGVVKKIDKNSAQLREALQKGKAIVITTLQKFPVISETMSGLKGQRFAVIIDEAHSSQSGEAAKHLKKTLHVGLEQAETVDEVEEEDVEDKILREIRNRGPQNHISYFAFTATPKNKTLELFGRATGSGEDRKFVSFHIYSMYQAIQENFILDVLKNYTTFKRYFKLVKKISADSEYEKKKAIRLLTSYVDLQPHAIETKCDLILDHFLEKTVHAIEGKGRAMLITRSRLHAVKYYLELKRIMHERGLGFQPLVAFSGSVLDPDTGAEYTENSLNRLANRVGIPDAFKTPDYRILVVANKFQTGYDEPLLHTMYVDKRLAGVQAVQALSRLNRTHNGKADTVVLDFVNEEEGIRDAFQPYYQTTMLEEETDPNRLYDLQTEINAFELFTDQDVNEFADIFWDKKQMLEALQPVLDRVVTAWNYKPEREREDFRSTIQKFIRLYGFISQIITFEDPALEKLYVFLKALNRKLPKRKGQLPYEVLDAVDLDSFRIQETYTGEIALEAKDGTLSGFTADAIGTSDPEMDLLSHIVTTLNETYGINITEDDKVDMQRMRQQLLTNEELLAVMNANNTLEAKRDKFERVLDEIILSFVHTKLDLYQKLNKKDVNTMLKRHWFDGYLKHVESKAG